jgi:Secretion system C-terminal sorting domain
MSTLVIALSIFTLMFLCAVDVAQAQAVSTTNGSNTPQSSTEHTGLGGGNNSHLLLIDDGRVYPNPSNGGGFLVDLPETGDRVVVLNSLGQLVPVGISVQNAGRTVEVTIPQYTPGIYFVRIQHNDNRTSTHRLLVR